MAIKRCTCKNEFQDEKYGKGKRVFTQSSVPKEGGTAKEGKSRCTVCGSTK